MWYPPNFNWNSILGFGVWRVSNGGMADDRELGLEEHEFVLGEVP